MLDEHLPLAVDLLSDIVLRPAFAADEIEREKKVILEEIKMVEDTPDDLVHELFTQHFWEGHPLGRPILGSQGDGRVVHRRLAARLLRRRLRRAERDHLGGRQPRARRACATWSSRAFGVAPGVGRADSSKRRPRVVPQVITRTKELEQSHICLGTTSYPQSHDDRYVSYILNTVLGGSMSSRLFQNVREKRGLAYAVFSGLSAYRDAGNITIYAGCANEAVGEVIELCVEELRGMKQTPVPDAELRRAKDHLKGSLMLSLENTASRMSHLARQEIYFDRHFGLDETLAGVERVTDRRRAARRARSVRRTDRWPPPCSARAFPICRARSWILGEAQRIRDLRSGGLRCSQSADSRQPTAADRD